MSTSANSKFRRIVVFCCMSLLSAGFSYSFAAAPLESSLETIVRSAPRDSVLTVLVAPSSYFDLSDLDTQLARSGASRRLRHQRVVEALKLETERAQAGLLRHLNAERSSGRVESYRAFWIANVVAVTTSVENLPRLAAHAEVGGMMENRPLKLMADKSKDGSGLSSVDAQTELAQTEKVFNWALRKINVRSLWQRGITGRGILVGNIDSGVDGSHPALASKWRGANGATVTESWYDPLSGSSFPFDDNNYTHGTMTMGLIVGQSGADTVGVAPDAQWIAAKGFGLGQGGDPVTLIDCMQWMADPDGDPATVDDVPDILNLSFADNVRNNECRTAYESSLVNLKLLGIVPIAASGNLSDHGPKVSSPANSPKLFAVTQIDSLNQFTTQSVPGPGYCDPNLIKPDLVAPGYLITSTKSTYYNSNLYNSGSGSSYACPIVSGVAALVRQANPELTPDQVYGVLRSSATDLGVTGPDTLFGYGAVNAEAAVNLAGSPSRPWLSITKIELLAGSDGKVSPGEAVGVVLTLYNNGTAASAVSAIVSSNKGDVTVSSGAVSFGSIANKGSAKNTATPFNLSFSQSIPAAEIRTFNLTLTSGQNTQTLAFAVAVGGEPVPPVEGIAAHDINQMGLTLTNYGTVGVNDSDGGGLFYPRVSTLNLDHLYQGGLLIGTGTSKISDASYNEVSTPGDSQQNFNRDFAVVAGGNLEFAQPGEYADQELSAKFADTRASAPLGVTIHQRSYGWSAEDINDFVIVEYALSGPQDSTTKNVYVAQHLDLDVNHTSNDDLVAFASDLRLLYSFDTQGQYYIGTVLLTQAVGGTGIFEFMEDITDGFSAQEKWTAMTSRQMSDTLTVAEGDYSQLLSAGPFNIKPGQTIPVAFAVVGGAGIDELRANASAARAKWLEMAALRNLDIAPPLVTVTPLRNQAPENGNYALDMTVADSATSVEDVSVIWRDIEPQPGAWSTVKANLLSINGDIYRAIIPGRAAGTRVQYYIRAIDTQGNQGIRPPHAPDELFTFYVGDTTRPVILASSSQSQGTAGIEVRATIDANDIAKVLLIVVPDSAAPDTLPMTLVTAGGVTYSAVISGLTPNTELGYYVEAVDTLGNYDRWPQSAPQTMIRLTYVPVLAGDGDLNGKVDIFDLLAMLKVISGRHAPDANEFAAMELDHNGKVNIFDLLELLKLLKS